MAGVQKIEDAVREDDGALRGPPGGRGVGGTDLGGGVQSGCWAFGWNAKLWLKNGSETVSL